MVRAEANVVAVHRFARARTLLHVSRRPVERAEGNDQAAAERAVGPRAHSVDALRWEHEDGRQRPAVSGKRGIELARAESN
jgi:hypothetical protein